MEKMNRDVSIDFYRGIAILLVVLGHTIMTGTKYYESTVVFNFIWAIQMPLFFLISGYVVKYSRPINSRKTLFAFLKRRTIAYLLPWIIWTFAIRGILFAQESLLNLKYLLWNMDSSYWFLISLWTITAIFTLSNYLASQISQVFHARAELMSIVIMLICLIFLASLGFVMGFSFIAIKYSLFYYPFYYLGYVVSRINSDKNTLVRSCVESSAIFAFVYLIVRIPVFSLPDTAEAIVLRAFISIAGCLAVVSVLRSESIFNSKVGGGYLFRWPIIA